MNCLRGCLLLISVAVFFFPLNDAGKCSKNGWFGAGDTFQCHCNTGSTCATDLEFPDDQCEIGWFGPQCQYVDIVQTVGIDPALKDGDPNTCIDVTRADLQFDPRFRFTWMRLVGENANDLAKLDIYFLKDFKDHTDDTMTIDRIRVNHTVLDVHADLKDLVRSIHIILKAGTGSVKLCSVYVSGGRNVLLKSMPDMRMPKRAANRATDGDSSTCAESIELTFNTNLLHSWETLPPDNVYIDSYDIISNDVAKCSMMYFHLVEYDSNDRELRKHEDKSIIVNILSRVRYNTGKSVDKVKIAISPRYYPNSSVNPCGRGGTFSLQLCEVQAFGDSVCATGKWGIGCARSCNCHNANNPQCYVSTGSCLSGCPTGYHGLGCMKECEQGAYGRDCKHPCSIHCVEGVCNATNGFCSKQCEPGISGNFCEKGHPSTTPTPTTWAPIAPKVTSTENEDRHAVTKTPENVTKKPGKACVPGTHGADCSQQCPLNCLNGTCHQNNVICVSCKAGFEGSKCEQACRKGVYGSDCLKKCSKNCKDGECDSVNGFCLKCIQGFHGSFCDHAFVHTPSKASGPSAGAIVLLLGMVIIVVIVIVVGYRVTKDQQQQPVPVEQAKSPDVKDSDDVMEIDRVDYGSSV